MVVVGPGDYLKPYQTSITKDGVRLHLLPGARIYDVNHVENIPVVNVASGTHWLTGHGTIEHQGGEPIIDVGEIVVGTDVDTLSIFSLNTARKIFLIRNYRSLRGISNIIILSPNHP